MGPGALVTAFFKAPIDVLLTDLYSEDPADYPQSLPETR